MTRGGEGVLNAFLRELMQDREAGSQKTCEEYQARWPEHAELIASEYASIARGDADLVTAGSAGFPVAFGRYELQRLMACGGQGSVYLARDQAGDPVAIKILSGLLTRSNEQVARFRREAAVIERLDHPGICKIREYGEHEGIPFIAMDYVEGVALSEKVAAWRVDRAAGRSAAERRAMLDEVLGIFRDLATALHCAHEKGVVHRDVKPQNIVIRPTGAPVILDFGIARGEDGAGTTLTRTGEVLGTPSYMSPEQIESGVLNVDARSDVFSLGVTLYEAVTGERPFQAPTCEGILDEIRHGEPRSPRAIDPALPRDLDLVLGMALEKTPARRYASAAELAADLDRLRRGESVAAKAPAPWTLVRRWARRNPRLAWAAGAVLAILASATVIGFYLRAKAVAALADYRRLADAATLLELKSAADELWPPVPELIPRYRAWLERADALAASLPHHEAELRNLESRGRRVEAHDEVRSIGARAVADAKSHRGHLLEARRRFEQEAKTSTDSERSQLLQVALGDIRATIPRLERALMARQRWRFDDPEDQSRYDIIEALVRDLNAFLDANRHVGLRADVRDRLEFASSVERRSLEEHADSWARAIAMIADRERCPKYDGLVIRPQLGLVPLGRDPASGLYEFMDLYTAKRGIRSEDVARAPDGSVPPTEDQGVVFVLIPGGRALRGSRLSESRPTQIDPYFIAKYEMMRGQWERLTGMRPSQHSNAPLGPVDCVTWTEADLWLRRAGMVVPTILQWEHAARGGTTTPWHTGSERGSLKGYANIAGSEFAKTGEAPVKHEDWDDGHEPPTEVGTFRPNGFGLHDVHGNLSEWTRDLRWTPLHEPRPGDGDNVQTREGTTDLRGQRGGSYRRDAIISMISYDLPKLAQVRDYESGLRAARNLDR
jgi:formylglycine-generating enzyme required for sulfatase activity